MKQPPPGWPRISPSLFYDDAATAIDWLCDAFGFELRLKVEGEGDRVVHSQLELPGGLIMVATAGSEGARAHCVSPRSVDGGNTQCVCIFVDDVDAHCERARAAGAVIATKPRTTDYGEDYWADRSYEAVDPEGHHWWFLQRVRGPGADAE